MYISQLAPESRLAPGGSNFGLLQGDGETVIFPTAVKHLPAVRQKGRARIYASGSFQQK